MTAVTNALTDREFMDALLNVLIPANEAAGVAGAGDLGLAPSVVEGVQKDPLIRPLVEPAAQAVMEAALSESAGGLPGMTPEAGAEFLKAQLAQHPMLAMGILRYLYPAYYQHPKVLMGIGEAARPPFPEGYDAEPTDPELLAKLQARRRTE